jgi:hypothetical protein
LYKSIKAQLESVERKVIDDKPVIAHIPRLDVISRFLSQGATKSAWYDLKKSGSEQRSVSDIMMNLIKRIEHRISDYAKV